MNTQANFVSGMLVGAGLMYMLDPARGRRRRALVGDQMVHAAHELEEAGEWLEGTSRHLGNRAHGIAAETRSRFRRGGVEGSTEAAGTGVME